MLIHNVYSDLLTSTTYFLNNYILTDHHTKIQTFQYTIGNSSFQLKYDTQFDLPAAIVTLQSPIPYSNHPYVFHRNIANNMNKIPVLYDRTKNLEIFLQEELYTVPVTININCDSQLQALEIQHRIQNYLPLNKYLQAHSYTSFFELDTNLLSKYLIDVDKDKIENLFYKQNKYTDSFDYCFSVEYEPITRLNSCDIGIDSSTNSSFQVACSFEFLTHIPIYLIPPKINWANIVEDNHIKYNNIPVPIRLNQDYIIVEFLDTDKITHLELWQFNDGRITGQYKQINKVLTAMTLVDKMKISCILHISTDLNDNILNPQCFIEGDRINGILRQVKYTSSNILNAYFVGTLNGKDFYDYLDFEFEEESSLKVIDSVFFTPNNSIKIKSYRPLPKKPKVINSITSINRSAVKINPLSTYITKWININDQENIIEPPITINQYTNEFTLPTGDIGFLDFDTFEIYLYNDNPNISYLYFNFSFDFVRGLPSSIERLSYNFNMNNQIIVNNSPYSTLKELNELNPTILSSISYDEDNTSIYFNIKDLHISAIKLINFKFITLNKEVIDSNYLSIDFTRSDTNTIYFKLINPKVYWKYFSNITTLYPIYFCYSLEDL